MEEYFAKDLNFLVIESLALDTNCQRLVPNTSWDSTSSHSLISFIISIFNLKVDYTN